MCSHSSRLLAQLRLCAREAAANALEVFARMCESDERQQTVARAKLLLV